MTHTKRAAVALSALLILQTVAPATDAQEPAKRIHTFVALCDNDSQGIVPVPKKIGNGNDPESNLYWGCSDGLKSYFSNSPKWRLVSKQKDPTPTILRRYTFQHKATKSILVADAYRGSDIKTCLKEFLSAAEDNFHPEIKIKDQGLQKFGAASDLIAYIGHNGLMEHKISPTKANVKKTTRDAIVLCCVSHSYFTNRLTQAGTRPVLMTDQLMYPGSFALHEALEVWFKKGTKKSIQEAAAKAMAKNQKISVKAARGIFTNLEE